MKTIQTKFYTVLFFVTSVFFVTSCGDDNFFDNLNSGAITGEITENTTWNTGNTYRIANKVVVQKGATLTIEPGVIIKAEPGAGADATALIVAKGGRIDAQGTENEPIIFTSIDDNIEVGQITGTNLTPADKGLWGGVIILGNAPVSVDGTDTEGQVEGVPATIPNTTYGGADINDNSGILKYVSIRHGGIELAAGKEINGLTLGGVGNGTIIDHIEVASNEDDGIECFGGTVNISNVVVSYCGDDALDFDQNYAGTVTNVVILQNSNFGDTDEALEIDGPEGSTHTDGRFTLRNASIMNVNGPDNGSVADLKSKAQGSIIDCSWEGYTSFIKIRASYKPSDACTAKTDAFKNMLDGKLVISDSEAISTSATMSNMTEIYSGDNGTCFTEQVSTAAEITADEIFMESGNTIRSTVVKGADKSLLSWSWTSVNGGF